MRYNSKMVQDKSIVSIKVESEVEYALSNVYVANDPQTTKIFAFFVAFNIFIVSRHRDFKFATQVGLN